MAVLEPILQPILGPILRPHYDPPQGVSLSVLVQALFAGGEKGVMFDLTRAANLYTDSARTTLVTASGDAIGSATDLSPNGKHASSSGPARPTWNSAGYATWDAFDDYLQTAAIDFSGTDAVTVVAAVRKLSDVGGAVLVELGPSGAAVNTFWQFAPTGPSGNNVSHGSRGSVSAASASYAGASTISPVTLVTTGESKISTDSSSLRINGVNVATSAVDQGAGNYSINPLNIGARNGGLAAFFNGRIYRLLVIGRALTTTERNLAERWAAQPVGITIP